MSLELRRLWNSPCFYCYDAAVAGSLQAPFLFLQQKPQLGSDPDLVSWVASPVEGFSVSSCYDLIADSKASFGHVNRYGEAWKCLWKTEVPTKIKVFGGRCFHNRLPMRNLLKTRGIMDSKSDSKCVFCLAADESMDHTFLHCPMVRLISREVSEWLGFPEDSCGSVKESFLRWFSFVNLRKLRKRNKVVFG
ncbi:unnamed protein product [Vicia faba]|uniref:Reverse transcriptase zinc-binding domain-containing protein n=1 Tax=Vicia faba TaxID=3906 RepID=A0AAV0YPJ1_VICFA|nr:unnamed protein product [Vicia faba]